MSSNANDNDASRGRKRGRSEEDTGGNEDEAKVPFDTSAGDATEAARLGGSLQQLTSNSQNRSAFVALQPGLAANMPTATGNVFAAGGEHVQGMGGHGPLLYQQQLQQLQQLLQLQQLQQQMGGANFGLQASFPFHSNLQQQQQQQVNQNVLQGLLVAASQGQHLGANLEMILNLGGSAGRSMQPQLQPQESVAAPAAPLQFLMANQLGAGLSQLLGGAQQQAMPASLGVAAGALPHAAAPPAGNSTVNVARRPAAANISHHVDNSSVRRVLLYVPSDDESLSPFQCYARQNIELFEAQEVDAQTGAQGRNKPVQLGQVGIRCIHCADLHPKLRTRAAVYYPSRLSVLYQAAQNIVNIHLPQLCESVPAHIRTKLVGLDNKRSSVGGGKNYWSDTAQIQGVVDTPNGLRFTDNNKTFDDDDDDDDEHDNNATPGGRKKEPE